MTKKKTNSHARGVFITFEGIDGSGKSTQLAKAAKYLRSCGYEVVTLRDPGSTNLSEKLRDLILSPKMSIDPQAELLLYMAARGQMVVEKIRPAIEAKKFVLCDRFHDSTVAYQGYGRGLDLQFVGVLRSAVVGATNPDLALVYDVDISTSLGRRKKTADRLEKEDRAFFTRAREGFRSLVKAASRRVLGRIVLIDATQSVHAVWEDTQKHLDNFIDFREHRRDRSW